MPYKDRSTMASFKPIGGSLWTRFGTSYTYHPSCSKPNFESSFENTSSSIDEPVDPGQWARSSEAIRYTNSGLRNFNYCHHLKDRKVLSEDGLVRGTFYNHVDVPKTWTGNCGFLDYISSRTTTEAIFRFEGGIQFWAEAMGLGPVSLDADPFLPIGTEAFTTKVRQHDHLALDSMIPTLEAGFSVPVFLLDSIFGLLSLLRSLQSKSEFKDFLRRWERKWKNKPLNALSSEYLAAIFGWIPLIKDLKAFVQLYFSVADIVHKFLENSGKRQTLHFEKGISPLAFQDQSWFDSSESSFEVEFWNHYSDHYCMHPVAQSLSGTFDRSRVVSELSYHATLDFLYQAPELSAFTQFYAEMDVWGINLSNVSDIWELVPFSFVIDWFLGIGPWLESFDVKNTPVHVVVFDFCRSYKYRLRETVNVTDVSLITGDPTYDNYPDGWTFNPTTLRASREVRGYYRVPGIPAPTQAQLPNFTFPNGMQWVTALALGLSRKR